MTEELYEIQIILNMPILVSGVAGFVTVPPEVDMEITEFSLL